VLADAKLGEAELYERVTAFPWKM